MKPAHSSLKHARAKIPQACAGDIQSIVHEKMMKLRQFFDEFL
jgi:hypothetical protein